MEPTGYEREPRRMDAAREKLGRIGRRLKRIEVHESIVEHPFAAIGIGAAIGAVVGLVRPMPRRSRIGNAMFAAVSAIGLRVVREAAMRQLGVMAKDWLAGQRQEPEPAPAGY